MPRNLWNDAEYRALPDLDGLVYRSNLLGRDRSVCNIYGGNTSVKLVEPDHLRRPTRVLYVKASGSDVLTIVAKQFAALRLDDIDPLIERQEMTDAEMTDYLSRTAFLPERPRQSIETLLHAFVPYKHVDHTHPDAVISLACTPHGEEAARKVYGDRMAWVDYIRPGFTLSKWIGQKVQENPSIECIVMGKHGLVTWGETAKSCYDHTISIIQEAEDYIKDQQKGKQVFGAVKVPPMAEEARRETAALVLPYVRGSCLPSAARFCPTTTAKPSSITCPANVPARCVRSAAACPDHLVHVKRQPLFIHWSPADGVEALKERLKAGIQDFRRSMSTYFNENKGYGDEIRDAAPRVILIPGLGMITTGLDATNADVSRQLYHRAISVIAASEAVGGFDSLTAAEAFDIEYWPLELYKLKLKPPDRDLAGKVVIITGAASGIGKATALRMAQEGAHVVIADINSTGAAEVAAGITKQFGFKRAMSVSCDVTSESAVAEAYRRAVLTYGGVDIVVNNAGMASSNLIEDVTVEGVGSHLRYSGEGLFSGGAGSVPAVQVAKLGGTMVFVGSKNSVSAGKGAARTAPRKPPKSIWRAVLPKRAEHSAFVSTASCLTPCCKDLLSGTANGERRGRQATASNPKNSKIITASGIR